MGDYSMTISASIDTALSLLYESKWNLKKREKAFTTLHDFFDDNQLAVIRKGYMNGLPKTHLQVFAHPRFKWQQMMIIEATLHEFSLVEIQHIANPILEVPQMQLIAEGIRTGLSTEQINYLIQQHHSIVKMKIILGAFQHGVTADDLIKIYRDIRNTYS